jgi:hypothetical protein
MPIKNLPNSGVFGPDAIKVLTMAYEDACAALHVLDREDPLTKIVAQKIIEHAQRGERDPILLRESVLSELRSYVPPPKQGTT